MGVEKDIIFANSVRAGDSKACELFVDNYTDLVLSTVWKLSKTHCNYPARERVCSLIILQKQRKGSAYFPEDQCGECMDSYIWFFDFLKNKVKLFKGKNNCSLKTFVWSILHSDYTYKDWLRWKYGRGDRLPVAIKNLNETYQKTYIYLRLRKSEDRISRLLNLSLDETREKINTVRTELIRAGQIYLIEYPVFISIHHDNPETQELPIVANEIDIDKRLIIKEFFLFFKETINELPDSQVQLLKLRYKHRMSAKDILEFCNKLNISLIQDKEIKEQKEHDIFYALNVALKDVLKRVKMRHRVENSFGMDNLKYIFKEMGA